jgi:hypothetical protein
MTTEKRTADVESKPSKNSSILKDIFNVKKIAGLLDSARTDKNETLLREAYQILVKFDEQLMLMSNSSQLKETLLPDPDIIALGAEVALEFPGCTDIANWCADKYINYNQKKIKKDFLARVYLVKAHVIQIQHQKINPIPQVCLICCRLSYKYCQGTLLNAVSFLLQTLNIITRSAKYVKSKQ